MVLDTRNTLEYGGVALLTSWAGVAQLVEQLICNQQVVGSSPVASLYFAIFFWGDARAVKGSGL